jgi:ribosomal protein L37AE/L43A
MMTGTGNQTTYARPCIDCGGQAMRFHRQGEPWWICAVCGYSWPEEGDLEGAGP